MRQFSHPPPWLQRGVGLWGTATGSVAVLLQSGVGSPAIGGYLQRCRGHGAPFVSAPSFQGVRQGRRQLERLASLAFTIYVNNKVSESNRASLFLYQLILSVLDSDLPLCSVPFTII